MQRLVALLLGLLAASFTRPLEAQVAESRFDSRHARWTRVLETFSTKEGVDYEALAKQRGELDRYLAELEAVRLDEFSAWPRPARLAFWINAYNAYTLRLVTDHLPLESIRDIGGEDKSPWDLRVVGLAHLHPGSESPRLTLNELEHEILRAEFEDARVHAAINCASKGCPPLRRSAFTAKRVDAELDEAARAWLADPLRFAFDAKARRVTGSEILRWFESDFVRDAGSTAKWLSRYAPEEQRGWLAQGPVRLEFKPYDWSLNAVEKKLSEEK